MQTLVRPSCWAYVQAAFLVAKEHSHVLGLVEPDVPSPQFMGRGTAGGVNTQVITATECLTVKLVSTCLLSHVRAGTLLCESCGSYRSISSMWWCARVPPCHMRQIPSPSRRDQRCSTQASLATSVNTLLFRPPIAGLSVAPWNKDDMGDGVPTDQLSQNHCHCTDSHCNSHIVTSCVFVLVLHSHHKSIGGRSSSATSSRRRARRGRPREARFVTLANLTRQSRAMVFA